MIERSHFKDWTTKLNLLIKIYIATIGSLHFPACLNVNALSVYLTTCFPNSHVALLYMRVTRRQVTTARPSCVLSACGLQLPLTVIMSASSLLHHLASLPAPRCSTGNLGFWATVSDPASRGFASFYSSITLKSSEVVICHHLAVLQGRAEFSPTLLAMRQRRWVRPRGSWGRGEG